MRRKLLITLCLAFFISGVSFAQLVNVSYNANMGLSTLGAGAANKVYWHSGGGVAGPWEAVVGNWGMDDGIGEMTEVEDDIWEIEATLDEYYAAAGYTGGAPVNHIGMVFRNEDGTLSGKNDGDVDIFAVYDAVEDVYTVDCACVTITKVVVQSVNTINGVSDITIGPNPFNTNVEFAFNLVNNEEVTLSIYNMMGAHVATILNGNLSAGKHIANWNAANLPAGNYMFRLQAGTDATSGSIVKL